MRIQYGDLSQTIEACENVRMTVTWDRWEGSWTFAEDGTFEARYDLARTISFTADSDCAAGFGSGDPATGCERLELGLQNAYDATCTSDETTGDCTCAATDEAAGTEDGYWETSGTTFEITNFIPGTYCVDGDLFTRAYEDPQTGGWLTFQTVRVSD